ncbi:MAG: hypothetical protein IRY86_09400 [Thermorudis peleae]|nr:hypothetical protein [Thermorudis peleae]
MTGLMPGRRASHLTLVLITITLLLSGCHSHAAPATPLLTPTSFALPITTPPATSSPTSEEQQPTPTPSPTPEVSLATPKASSGAPSSQDVSDCCGLFAWLDDHRLLVYRTSSSPAGLWVIDLADGQAHWLDSMMGLPSAAGLIAIPDPAQRVTRVRDASGTLVSTIANGGVVTWISPDGQRAAWLERLPIPSQSSSVNPAVRLWVSNRDGTNAHPLLSLQAATLAWTADSKALLARARTLDGQQSGIWRIDATSGTVTVLVSADFIYNVRLSPSGTRVGYAIGLSATAEENGCWIMDVQSQQRTRLPLSTGFRLSDDATMWTIQPGIEHDTVLGYRLGSATPWLTRDLPGQVQNDDWEVSPGGKWLAFWRQEDHHVVVLALEAD